MCTATIWSAHKLIEDFTQHGKSPTLHQFSDSQPSGREPGQGWNARLACARAGRWFRFCLVCSTRSNSRFSGIWGVCLCTWRNRHDFTASTNGTPDSDRTRDSPICCDTRLATSTRHLALGRHKNNFYFADYDCQHRDLAAHQGQNGFTARSRFALGPTFSSAPGAGRRQIGSASRAPPGVPGNTPRRHNLAPRRRRSYITGFLAPESHTDSGRSIRSKLCFSPTRLLRWGIRLDS